MSMTHAHRGRHAACARFSAVGAAASPLRRALVRGAAGAALAGGLLVPSTVPASAAPVLNSSAVLASASEHLGTPYRFGGTTPAGFDCSGYTQHVYAENGIALPRTTGEQLASATRIAKSDARPGDLVFFVNAQGRPYHVGIYTGEGRMMDSPRSGKTVSERSIWSDSAVYARA